VVELEVFMRPHALTAEVATLAVRVGEELGSEGVVCCVVPTLLTCASRLVLRLAVLVTAPVTYALVDEERASGLGTHTLGHRASAAHDLVE
jgi:hypothetical protein